MCQTMMKEWQVFRHLDACSGPTLKKPGSESSSKTTSTMTSFDRTKLEVSKNLARLPALNYSMLKEQALRKKLSELGISNTGSRALLERRHKEWMTIWNANCDSANPKRRADLLQDLEVWERTQGGRAPTFSSAAHSSTMVKDKDFDGAAWAVKHDTTFKDLITNARKSRLVVKQKENTEDDTTETKGDGGNGPDTNTVASGRDRIDLTDDNSTLEHAVPGLDWDTIAHGGGIGTATPEKMPSTAQTEPVLVSSSRDIT
jgi:E3 ubiquitin-protein ligase RAD18